MIFTTSPNLDLTHQNHVTDSRSTGINEFRSFGLKGIRNLQDSDDILTKSSNTW